jgi:hypothetical protein
VSPAASSSRTAPRGCSPLGGGVDDGASEAGSTSTTLEAEDGCVAPGGVILDDGEEAGLVRPCIKVRTREGEGVRDATGEEATRCGVWDRALATISLPLAVTGE